MTKEHAGFAISLAWPETRCRKTGMWYDVMMSFFGIAKEGYYKVGHAAILLIDAKSGDIQYFDFGRYYAAYVQEKVRSQETDQELIIHSKAEISQDGKQIFNLEKILWELYKNRSTNGSGYLKGAQNVD